jgi:hypothetical protein
MLTNRSLFGGSSERATLSSHKQAEIPPPSPFAPEVPPSLDRAVLTALVRDPDRRFRSAADFGQALEEAALSFPSRHGDLTALFERLAGSPRESGPTRTLVGEPAPSPRSSGSVPVLRELRLSPAPSRRDTPEKTPTTRLMGDTTLAAILSREPRRKARGRASVLGDPRALLVGAGGLAVGLLLAAAVLTGKTKVGGDGPPAERSVTAPSPAAPIPAAAPSPAPSPAAATVGAPVGSNCTSPDAGPPCWMAPVEPSIPPPRRLERRNPRRSSSSSSSSSQAPPSRPELRDRRPNPFGE